MLDVCLLGSGGMMPLPYRWLTSLMTRFNGSSLLIDCGEGTQIAIKEKGWSFKPIDVICFTHYHGDHISRASWTSSHHGKCRSERTADFDRTKKGWSVWYLLCGSLLRNCRFRSFIKKLKGQSRLSN